MEVLENIEHWGFLNLERTKSLEKEPMGYSYTTNHTG